MQYTLILIHIGMAARLYVAIEDISQGLLRTVEKLSSKSGQLIIPAMSTHSSCYLIPSEHLILHVIMEPPAKLFWKSGLAF